MNRKIKMGSKYFSIKRGTCLFVHSYTGNYEASINEEDVNRIDIDIREYTPELLEYIKSVTEFTKDTYTYANKYDESLIGFLQELGFKIIEPLSNTYSQYMRYEV